MEHSGDGVLIVDDDASVRWALAHVLQGCGVAAVTVGSADEALAMVRPGRFRLAFVDAKLPDVEGTELARQLRNVDPALSIVLISAYYYRDDVDVHAAIDAGTVIAFIAKPFSHDELRALVNQTLGGGAPAAGRE